MMTPSIRSKLLLGFAAVVLFCLPSFSVAQEGLPPQAQQMVESGRISPQQAREAMDAYKKGEISQQDIQRAQEQGLGNLSPAEIEKGKELLQQKEQGKEGAPAEAQKEPSKKAEEPAQEEKEPPVEEKPEMAEEKPEQQELVEKEEEFYSKKQPAPEAELPIFGHNLFADAPSTFAPIQTLPVSDDYVIGPGDEIKVLMWGRIDATHSLVVDNEGVINFPQIGPLTVAGLTFSELKRLIEQQAGTITGVNVHVSMGKLRTIQVFVLGEVRDPGIYTVSSLATMINALFASGGPTRLGSLRQVQLKRQSKVVTTLDLYDFLLRGDNSADVRLTPGDVIFVPQAGPMIKVRGNVKRPAVYEGTGDQTLQQMIELAGGLAPRASDQRIQIERAFENKMQIVLDIPFEQLRRREPVPLQDGDIVRVFSILPGSVNAVYLYGNVLRPGQYAYTEGMKLLDIIPDIGALAEDTHLGYALIKRYRPKDMEAELIPFRPGRLLIDQAESENIALQPLDEIYLFSKWRFEDRPRAQVEGEVRNPGTYLIHEMNIKDLIQRAGDLTDEAYLHKGELIRTDEDQKKHTIYFDVAAAMEGDPEHNLPVRDQDILIVHSVWEDQWREFVTVRGEVKNPDTYRLTEGMRISDLIFKAGRFTRDAYERLGHLYRTDWRTRKVTILTFNAEKALKGDPAHNLLLQDLDEVVVHNISEYVTDYDVTISGMVNKPGQYPYAVNMSVRDLIFVAGNTRDAAYMEQGELVRYVIEDGEKVETLVLPFNVRAALAGDPRHDIPLQPLDSVTIKEIPEWWEKKKVVSITGEVMFPGNYRIRKDERLSDVIERAGGFAPNAYLRGATFTRESAKELQRRRLQEMMEKLEVSLASYASAEAQAAVDQEDIAAQKQFLEAQKMLLAKLEKAEPTGRVVISLQQPDVLKATSSDIVLEGGDHLHVPQEPSTVTVMGAVYNPTSLVFQESKPELKHYLSRVGGPTENAEEDHIYVVRADGTVVSRLQGKSFFGLGASWDQDNNRWAFGSSFESMELYPGDTILVPHKVVRPSFLKTAKDVTQIMFQLAVTAGVLIEQVFP